MAPKSPIDKHRFKNRSDQDSRCGSSEHRFERRELNVVATINIAQIPTKATSAARISLGPDLRPDCFRYAAISTSRSAIGSRASRSERCSTGPESARSTTPLIQEVRAVIQKLARHTRRRQTVPIKQVADGLLIGGSGRLHRLDGLSVVDLRSHEAVVVQARRAAALSEQVEVRADGRATRSCARLGMNFAAGCHDCGDREASEERGFEKRHCRRPPNVRPTAGWRWGRSHLVRNRFH